MKETNKKYNYIYSLNRTAPTLTTKKNVAIIKLIIVVKLRVITICVAVMFFHQGVSSIASGCIVGESPAGSPKGFLAIGGLEGMLLLLLKGLAVEPELGPNGLTGVLSAENRVPLFAGVFSMLRARPAAAAADAAAEASTGASPSRGGSANALSSSSKSSSLRSRSKSLRTCAAPSSKPPGRGNKIEDEFGCGFERENEWIISIYIRTNSNNMGLPHC